jgi:hypothetical protein
MLVTCKLLWPMRSRTVEADATVPSWVAVKWRARARCSGDRGGWRACRTACPSCRGAPGAGRPRPPRTGRRPRPACRSAPPTGLDAGPGGHGARAYLASPKPGGGAQPQEQAEGRVLLLGGGQGLADLDRVRNRTPIVLGGRGPGQPGRVEADPARVLSDDGWWTATRTATGRSRRQRITGQPHALLRVRSS